MPPSRDTEDKDPRAKEAAKFVKEQLALYWQDVLSKYQQEKMSEIADWTWSSH